MGCLWAVILAFACPSNAYNPAAIRLEKNNIRLVVSDKEPGPIKVALKALKRDFLRVMDTDLELADTVDVDTSRPEIVIVNRGSGALQAP